MFDGARRLIDDHQLARIADVGKRMGDFARSKYRVARLQSERVLSNLEQELALPHEKPFILGVMKV